MPVDSILEPKPLPARRSGGKFLLGALALLAVATGLYFQFRNFREEAEVKKFFSSLTQADYGTAYRLWKPAPSYTLGNFMEDWGPGGPWGRVQKFEVLDSRRRGESVVVTVRINDRAEPAEVWVSRRDRSLSFPPF